MAFVAVVVGALSALTYVAIERPAMHLARSRKRAVARPAGLMVETTPA
jgi:peptidoglycan/LPS O-acetylase OafA/YrhL